MSTAPAKPGNVWRSPLSAALPLALAITLLCATAAIAQVKPLILSAIQVAREGDTVVIVVEGDGPLPVPATGTAESPPRFFLDFPGAITGIRGPQAGSGAVTRVRVALNSSNPPVTRVVLDLAQPQPVRLDTTTRETGRIRILVGAGAPVTGPPAREPEHKPVAEPPTTPLPVPSLPLVPPLPVSAPPAADREEAPVRAGTTPPMEGRAAPAERAPVAPEVNLPPAEVYPVRTGAPPAKPSADEVSRYREQVSASVSRLLTLRPLLTEIDRQEAKLPEGLTAARSDISGVIRALAAVRPPETLAPTHDMLLRGASLSMMATTLRADTGTRGDPTAIRNASSAAAGALLLLDRVCIEVGCHDMAGRK